MFIFFLSPTQNELVHRPSGVKKPEKYSHSKGHFVRTSDENTNKLTENIRRKITDVML